MMMINTLIKVLLLITICVCKTVDGLELDPVEVDHNSELEFEEELELVEEHHPFVPARLPEEYLRGTKQNYVFINEEKQVSLDGDDVGDDTGNDIAGSSFWDKLNNYFLDFKNQYLTFEKVGTKKSTGISFTRKVEFKSDEVNIAVDYDDNHCKSKDDYGDNECHYNWGETMNPQIDVKFKTEGDGFKEGDLVKGSMRVGYIVPWYFTCAVCGKDCVLRLPIVFFPINIPLPPCPMGKEEIPSTLSLPVGSSSPFHGIPLHLKGDLTLKRGKEVLAKTHIVVDVA